MFRNTVRAVLIGCLVAAVSAVAVWIVTGIVRAGMIFLYQLVVEGVPAIVKAVIQDPVLIICIAVASLIVYSLPWESILDYGEKDNHIRGRSKDPDFHLGDSIWEDHDE